MTINTTRWDSAEYLKTEEDVQLYLEACLEEAGDDPAFIAHALGVVARAKNMSQLASAKQGLLDCIEEIRKNFASIRGFHEYQARQSIIQRILHLTGWDIFNHEEVRVEYNHVENGSVDYALIVGDHKLFIEAKAPTPEVNLENHQDQLCAYSLPYDKSPPPNLAILTNGIQWWFYLPIKKTAWRDRKFCTINILSQDIEGIVDQLQQLLSRENVVSGAAFEYAEKLPKESDAPNGKNPDLIKKVEDWVKSLAKEFGMECKDRPTKYSRHFRVWFPREPWGEWQLAYDVYIAKKDLSAQIGFYYKESTLRALDESERLFECVQDLQDLKVFEGQVKKDYSTGQWKEYTRVFVGQDANSGDDEFLNVIDKTLRCYIKTITPRVEACWHQYKQQNT